MIWTEMLRPRISLKYSMGTYSIPPISSVSTCSKDASNVSWWSFNISFSFMALIAVFDVEDVFDNVG